MTTLAQQQAEHAFKCASIYWTSHNIAMLQWAIQAYQKARGFENNDYFKLTEQELINRIQSPSGSPDQYAFAGFANSKRHMAVRPDCVFDEAAWKCLLDWYAKPTNQSLWFESTLLDVTPPDGVFTACYTGPLAKTPTNDLPWQVIPADPTLISYPAPTPTPTSRPDLTQPDWTPRPDQGAEAEPPKKSNTMLWVGLSAVLGAAAVGAWYLTREPEPEPVDKTRAPKRRGKR